MKRIGLLGVYEWGLLAIIFLVVLHAPFSVLAGSLLPEQATILKAWKEIMLAVLGLCAVMLVTRNHVWGELLRSWAIRLSLAFIGLHILLALILGGDADSIVAGLMIDLRFAAMFLLVYILAMLRSGALRRILLSVAAGAVAVLGFGLLQITVLPDDILRDIGYSRQTITPYTTIDSNPDYVRINSTLRGPNPLGALAVLYAALASAYFLKHRWRVGSRRHWLIAAGFVASTAVLFASYSRSAYIAFGLTLGLCFVATKRLSKRVVLAAGAGSLLLTTSLLLVSTTDWYSNVILHEDPESTVVSKSNEGHVESFVMGATRAVAQPLGAGIGSTGSASLYDDDQANDVIIENYYFFVAHESGWLGLGLFIGLFGVIMLSLWRQKANWVALAVFTSGIGLAVIGILLPVWVDETVALIWWGMAGALASPRGIIGGSHGRTTRKQTTTGTA